MNAVAHIVDYRNLVAAKKAAFQPRGIVRFDEADLPDNLFPHQRHGTAFALRAGAAGLFYDTGLGKTAMALTWGDVIVRRENKPVIMLAPLACAAQHKAEADKFGIEATISRDGSWSGGARIVITNYERLSGLDPASYSGVILDESSILKSFTGKTTRRLIEAFAKTPFRLAATATPAPNDHTELGQHSEFLGVMPSPEMLSRWFIADQSLMGRYRLKRPAVRPFWEWVASWARAVGKPSDLGFSDDGFDLPPLDIRRHVLASDMAGEGLDADGQSMLFRKIDVSATSLHREKRRSSIDRAEKVAAIAAAEPGEPRVVWVDTDYDADAIMAAIPGAVEVRGSMRVEVKEERLEAFTKGEIATLVTKPSIAGFGLNWQHCARHTFSGLSFSYEAFYQALRRSWRFRQTRPVVADVVMSDAEDAIWRVINRKASDHDAMKTEMAAAMRRAARSSAVLQTYQPQQEARLPAWL